MVVSVVLQSGPAFAAASVVAVSEAPRSAVVSAGVRLVEAGTDNAWKSLTTKTAALDPIDRWPQHEATVDPESTITRRDGCFRQKPRNRGNCNQALLPRRYREWPSLL